LLDASGQPVPHGVPGELYIGGAGVARGYHHRPELTAEKFVADPFVADHDARMYRTGDLVRYRDDGVLEFLGRTDHQIKVRGHRIEPGEIEAALDTHPAVRRAVVVATGPRNTLRLHGFVQISTEVNEADLNAHLGARIPAYAIPGRIEPITEFPLTSNGKVDRTELAAMAARAPVTRGEPPAGDLEQRIATAWADVLGTGIDDRRANFFACGGTSLSALRMLTAVRQLFEVDMETRDFLAAPTVAGLAVHVEKQLANQSSLEIGTL